MNRLPAAARIRATVIDELRIRFESFISSITAEERMILAEVLTVHESTTRGAADELPLATAMEAALGKHEGDWVRVPYAAAAGASVGGGLLSPLRRRLASFWRSMVLNWEEYD